MTTSNTEIRLLIKELHELFIKAQAQREFLSLKQAELCPHKEISYNGFLQAREQLSFETSLLAGHVQMLQEIIKKENVSLDLASKRLLRTITTYSRQQVVW